MSHEGHPIPRIEEQKPLVVLLLLLFTVFLLFLVFLVFRKPYEALLMSCIDPTFHMTFFFLFLSFFLSSVNKERVKNLLSPDLCVVIVEVSIPIQALRR